VRTHRRTQELEFYSHDSLSGVEIKEMPSSAMTMSRLIEAYMEKAKQLCWSVLGSDLGGLNHTPWLEK
jgi:hypothetical protein